MATANILEGYPFDDEEDEEAEAASPPPAKPEPAAEETSKKPKAKAAPKVAVKVPVQESAADPLPEEDQGPALGEPLPPPIVEPVSMLDIVLGMLPVSVASYLRSVGIKDIEELDQKTLKQLQQAYRLNPKEAAEIEAALLSFGKRLPREQVKHHRYVSAGTPMQQNRLAQRRKRIQSLRSSR